MHMREVHIYVVLVLPLQQHYLLLRSQFLLVLLISDQSIEELGSGLMPRLGSSDPWQQGGAASPPSSSSSCGSGDWAHFSSPNLGDGGVRASGRNPVKCRALKLGGSGSLFPTAGFVSAASLSRRAREEVAIAMTKMAKSGISERNLAAIFKICCV